jgi:N6-L-threonylcarbamoyladenine synthase
LFGCVQVGVRHALSIAAAARKPIVPVHHMEAHALVTRMPGVVEPPMQFPALLLLVSGGHNMLVGGWQSVLNLTGPGLQS